MILIVALQKSLFLCAGNSQHRIGHPQWPGDLVPQLSGIAFSGAGREDLPQQAHSEIAVTKGSVHRLCNPVGRDVGIELLWSVILPTMGPVREVDVVGHRRQSRMMSR